MNETFTERYTSTRYLLVLNEKNFVFSILTCLCNRQVTCKFRSFQLQMQSHTVNYIYIKLLCFHRLLSVILFGGGEVRVCCALCPFQGS